jgi:Zn-dependent oligopeptidase
VRNIFHEFGHALNVALSNTKYQYYCCARGTTDLIEIPSHFTELFLKDYSFVRKFATVMEQPPMPSENENIKDSIDRQFAKPTIRAIDRGIFNKMLFCEEIFRFLNFEETLYFTKLDYELNSISVDEKIDS